MSEVVGPKSEVILSGEATKDPPNTNRKRAPLKGALFISNFNYL